MSRVRGQGEGATREASNHRCRGRELGAPETELSFNDMSPDAETIFYDGECGLCHRAIRFVLRHDRQGRFRFAPLHGETFLSRVPEIVRLRLPDTLVVALDGDRYLVRSEGVLHILERLGMPWRLVARVTSWLPRSFTDWIYDLVAARRARLFSGPDRVCPTDRAELVQRFDP